MDQLLFYLFLLSAVIHLGQLFFYGFQESNRPMILFGIVFLYLAFNLNKTETWITWACIIVPLVGFIGMLSGFSDSLKPSWLKYTILFINLLLFTLCVINLF